MPDQGPVAQEQLAELRTLNALKANGEISNAEYKKRKASVMNRGLVVQATTRTVSGISEKSLSVSSGPAIPGFAKLLITAAVFLVIAGIGWSALQSMSGDTSDAQQADAGAAGPTVASADLSTVDAVLDSAAPDPVADAEDDAEPDADLESVNVSANMLDFEGAGTLDLSRVTDMEELPADAVSKPDLDQPLSWLKPVQPPKQPESDTPAQRVDDDPPTQPTRTTTTLGPHDHSRPDGPGFVRRPVGYEPPPPRPQVKWNVYLADLEPTDTHPFVDLCDVTKVMRNGVFKARIGVTAGPACEGLEDDKYIDFRDAKRQELINAIDGAAPGQFGFIPSPKPMTIGELDITGERLLARSRSSLIGVIFTTVHNGHAYAYWFEGHQSLYKDFDDTVGKARVVEP